MNRTAASHDTEPVWSTPYHGVQHRMISGRQCTITDNAGTITAVVFGRRGSGRVLSDTIDAPVTFASIAAARMWCARTAAGDRFGTLRELAS